jgi:hypothetical protein
VSIGYVNTCATVAADAPAISFQCRSYEEEDTCNVI